MNAISAIGYAREIYFRLILWQKQLSGHHIMTSPWYFSTGALFKLVLKSNNTLKKQINYVIRIIIIIILPSVPWIPRVKSLFLKQL